jgi:hypothetical protein
VIDINANSCDGESMIKCLVLNVVFLRCVLLKCCAEELMLYVAMSLDDVYAILIGLMKQYYFIIFDFVKF